MSADTLFAVLMLVVAGAAGLDLAHLWLAGRKR